MGIQQEIHATFTQDFRSKEVLGRVLFGLSFIILGLLSISQMSSLASYAPIYVPFASLFVLIVGIVFLIAGICIAANKHVKNAAYSIAGIFALFALFLHLPNNDMISVFQDTAFIGAALLLASLAR